MGAHAGCAFSRRIERPRFEVADIFRTHGPAYRQAHVLSPEQKKVMWAIPNCRTPVLGGHEHVCLDCGARTQAYNACRNRHCPKCQALDQARWLEERKQRILPTPYFHVVFTLPSQLRPLAKQHPRPIYDLLFLAASQTLLQLGRDPQRLGATIGFTAVLHTWTRDLRYHVHLHCIVTAGGLSPDARRWVPSHPRYLFPIPVLSQLFRGKFLHGLERLHRQGKISLPAHHDPAAGFDSLRRTLYAKDWVVYAKPPFAGPKHVFRYLARYTHRVGISNHRIQEITPHAVTFSTRGRQTATLSPSTFIGRLLQHVLPKGFVKIRHYGLLASSHVYSLLAIAKALLVPAQADTPAVPSSTNNWQERLLRLTGRDLRVCPVCGSQRLADVPVPAPLPRAPPGVPL